MTDHDDDQCDEPDHGPAKNGRKRRMLSDTDVDPGVITYEMAVLVKRVGEHISSRPRQGTH
jgi:hypothetical protein